MLPRQQHTVDTIWGHAAVRQLVPRLLAAGRLPHALLLTGPASIGKRSLALAMAKAILSAGRPPVGGALEMPVSPARRRIDPPGDEGDGDLFGEGDDLFGEEPDLFGSLEEPDTSSAPAAPEEPPPSPPRPKGPQPLPPAPRQPPPTQRPTFSGYDPRVCRLVEASYPPEYDKNGRHVNTGYLDFTVVEPAGGRRGIVVDQIRALQETANTPPVEGAFRVVVIFGADTITQEGGNSMLKLLEEPPGYLVMILTAERASGMLPTILSRCMTVPMGPMAVGDLAGMLVERGGMEGELAGVTARLSEGRVGVSLAALESALLERRRSVFDARLEVDRYGWCAVPSAAARLAGPRDARLAETLWLLTSFCRDRLVRAVAPDRDDLLVHRDNRDLVEAASVPAAELAEEAARLVAAFDWLNHPYVPNQRVALETILFS